MIMTSHNTICGSRRFLQYLGTKYTLDLYNKANRAINEFKGAKFINVIAPCPKRMEM